MQTPIYDPKLMENDLFILIFKCIAARAHANAVEKGFWEGKEGRNLPEQIALMHSELSEALEAIRHDNPADDHIPTLDSLSVEFADCIIRIMDTSQAYGLPVAEAIIEKMEFNKSRPAKHGKAF